MKRARAAFCSQVPKSLPACGPSHSLSNVTSTSKARWAARKGQQQLSDPERFFSTASKDPDLCAYGPEHVHQALQMYAVDELMVAETGRPGGLDIIGWTALAANHKVPVINVVRKDSSAGKRFCTGVGIGGLLRRPMEFVVDSPVCTNVTSLSAMTFAFRRRMPTCRSCR